MQTSFDWVIINFGTQGWKKKWPVPPEFPDYLYVSYGYGENDGTWKNTGKRIFVRVFIVSWQAGIL